MKTWTFVAEVFWLCIETCLCRRFDEQTANTPHNQPITYQMTTEDSLIPRWYSAHFIRPPPLGA